MVFAALDYWTAGRAPPRDTSPPSYGSPLFGYLVRRLIDSWGLPTGPATYFQLMQPWYPDGDRQVGPFTAHGRAWRMAVREWPAIRAALDAGHPCPLGLVKVSSANPADLGKNHQVLAYGYHLVGTAVTLRVYDPNQADNDSVTISFDVADPTAAIPVTMTPDVSAASGVLCFFQVEYRPKWPPAER
jgi:hypothetical protein